tara:strand:- start:163 stop:1902 length:1740 start_codon:yes stop_codon:yes gene_type:complete
MKILKQLSKIILKIILILFFYNYSFANDPIDIWKIEKREVINSENSASDINANNNLETNTTPLVQSSSEILINKGIESSTIKLAGLYDPAQNGLKIDMWSKSDGELIKSILTKNLNRNLSKFSNKILDIALLTNSYIPTNNITEEEFLEFKFNYLINKKDFELIKKFLIKNPEVSNKNKLIKFYAEYFLSISEVKKACEIFNISGNTSGEYLNNFKIYCLILDDKKEQAQLIFDLSKESDEIDTFFENKFNILMGYTSKDDTISDENILYFHISHKTNNAFNYEPKINSPRYIWSYLSSSNILKNINSFDIENPEDLRLLERATHENVFDERELLDTYKKFQFNLTQLLNAKDSYKLLPDYEGRALLYQRLLLSVDVEKRLDMTSELYESFKKSKLENAFDNEIKLILKKIKKDDIPSNYTTFYENNIENKLKKEKKIKFNNKKIHQSKLLNYFLNKTSLPKAEKETNDLLKKIKRDKKYVFSKKDMMLIESLKSDGIKIDKKYSNLYEYNFQFSSDIKQMLSNGELGLLLIKIVDIIGENNLEDLDINTVNLLVSTMNELKNVDLRNEILIEVLPLKV